MKPSRITVRPTLAALLAVCLLPALIATGGCKRGAGIERISRILADPFAFETRDVTVAGRVTRVLDPSSGLLQVAAYQVEDDTGRIWVISRNGAPSVGREVGLKGRVRQDFKLGSEVFGAVLNEVDRRTR